MKSKLSEYYINIKTSNDDDMNTLRNYLTSKGYRFIVSDDVSRKETTDDNLYPKIVAVVAIGCAGYSVGSLLSFLYSLS